MIKLNATFVGVLIVVQVVSAGILPWWPWAPVEKVDKYLVEELPGNQDLDQNLKAAVKWKQELNNNPDASNNAVIEVLSVLEALYGAFKQPQCDKQMYDTVDKSAEFVGHRCLDPKVNNLNLSRLQYIVRLAAQKIASVCYKQHETELDKRLQSLNAETLTRVKQLPILCYSKGPFVWDHDTCTLSGKKVHSGDIRGLTQHLLNRMKASRNSDFKYLRLVKDENGGKVVMEDKVKEVVMQYITIPCNYLSTELNDLISLVSRNSVYMNTIEIEWLRKTKSPFEPLLPASCVCNLLATQSGESFVRQVINMIPEAQDTTAVQDAIAGMKYTYRTAD